MPKTNREQDDNGFLLVKGCPISSFGLFDYSAGQLGLPGDPNRIVKVYRPESAVSDPAAIESFKNVPLINDHEMLSGFLGDKGTTAPEEYGIDGILTSNVYYEAPWMRGDLKVFTRKLQEALQSGKKDLSLGYTCDFEIKPGVWNGQPYEAIQTNMRGNHIALVDEGRVPGARVLDGLCFDSLSFNFKPSNKDDQSMKIKDKKAFDDALASLKALLPALSQHLNAGTAGAAMAAARKVLKVERVQRLALKVLLAVLKVARLVPKVRQRAVLKVLLAVLKVARLVLLAGLKFRLSLALLAVLKVAKARAVKAMALRRL